MSSIESHLSNKPKQVFFNPINIFDTFTTLYYTIISKLTQTLLSAASFITKRELIEEKFGPIQNWDTSQVTNMANLFIQQKELATLDLSKWDVLLVTNMLNST